MEIGLVRQMPRACLLLKYFYSVEGLVEIIRAHLFCTLVCLSSSASKFARLIFVVVGIFLVDSNSLQNSHLFYAGKARTVRNAGLFSCSALSLVLV